MSASDLDGEKPGSGESEGRTDLTDDVTFASAVKMLMADAISYVDDTLAPARELATSYYRGDMFGDEEDGRSKVVMSEVRDVVQAMLPSLLRIFTGSQQVVEFAPRTPDKVPAAEQATDYVNYIFYSENQGFRLLYNAFKDALVRRTGILHWYMEEKEDFEDFDYSEMDEEQIALLENDDEIEILDVTPSDDEPVPGSPPLSVVRVRRRKTTKRLRVETIPPEEFFISRDAKDEDDAFIIGRRRDLTVGDLVALGYDEDEIRANMGSGASMELNTEATVRNEALNNDTEDKPDEEVAYFEVYVRLDRDNDGIPELVKVCGINLDSPHILHEETWADGSPFGILCPDPEPHMAVGYSVADQVMDLQRIKSNVIRNTLDSLANAIHPRTAIVEDQVNVDDALNTEQGAIIRMRAPGMVQELVKPFVGQYSLPIIEYLDQTRAKRTGITEASQGLDADVLQSTTKAAVTATVSGAQERIEMVARIFAETGLRRLFRGLLKLAIRHMDREQVIRLRNTWVPVDPRVWDADMDVVVNIGLGRGGDNERLALMQMIAMAQKEAIQLAGPTNEFANLGHLRNTYATILEIGGVKDPSKFFGEVNIEAMKQAAAQQPPPPNPAVMLAEVEMQKAQIEQQAEEAKHQRELLKMKLENDLARDRLAQELYLKQAEIEARYGAQVQIEQMKAEIEAERNDIEMAMGVQTADTQRQHELARSEADRQHQAAQAHEERRANFVNAEMERRYKAQGGNADRQMKAQQSDRELTFRQEQARADAAMKAKAAAAKPKGPAR
jgi:hypothetical protein